MPACVKSSPQLPRCTRAATWRCAAVPKVSAHTCLLACIACIACRLNLPGTSPWETLDFGDVVVHVFTAQQREYYDIESFYAGGRPDRGWAKTRVTLCGWWWGGARAQVSNAEPAGLGSPLYTATPNRARLQLK